MAGALGGSFTITAVVDGATYQGTIHSDKPLLQFYNKTTGTATPSWDSTSTDSPTFYMVIRDQSGKEIAYNASDVSIYYGGALVWDKGAAVTLGGVNYIATAGENAEHKVPQYKFIANVASATNMDDDQIYMTAKVNISGTSITIQSSVKPIQIRASEGGAAYILTIMTDDIHEQGEQGVLKAVLTDQTGTSVSAKSYQWYNLTGDESSPISGATQSTLTVTSDDIDGYDAFRCVATLSDDTTIAGVGGIKDYSDPYYADWELDPAGGTIRNNNKDIKATPKLYDDKGNVLTKGSNGITDITMTATFVDASGNTISGMTADSNGAYTITYDKVVDSGGQMSGYVTATVTLE